MFIGQNVTESTISCATSPSGQPRFCAVPRHLKKRIFTRNAYPWVSARSRCRFGGFRSEIRAEWRDLAHCVREVCGVRSWQTEDRIMVSYTTHNIRAEAGYGWRDIQSIG